MAFPWGVLLAGLGGIAVGILTLLWPGLTALTLLYLIAVWAVVRGVFEIIAAFHLRRELESEWFLALSGLLSVTLGVGPVWRPGRGPRLAPVDRRRCHRVRRLDHRPRRAPQGVKDRLAPRPA